MSDVRAPDRLINADEATDSELLEGERTERRTADKLQIQRETDPRARLQQLL